MAEYSWFWEDIVTGDASLAPYSNDEFSDVWGALTQFDRRSSFIVFADQPGSEVGLYRWSGAFEHSVEQLAKRVTFHRGAAIVDGKAYFLGSSKTFFCDAVGYYRFILRKYWASRNVTIEQMYNYFEIPAMAQQKNVEWDISLLTGFVDNSGILYVSQSMPSAADEIGLTKWFNSVPCFAGRQGGSSTNWSTAGNANYLVDLCRMEIGSVSISGTTTTVQFGQAFTNPPLVLLMPTSSSWAGNNLFVSRVTSSEFDIKVDNASGLSYVFYLAFGSI